MTPPNARGRAWLLLSMKQQAWLHSDSLQVCLLLLRTTKRAMKRGASVPGTCQTDRVLNVVAPGV